MGMTMQMITHALPLGHIGGTLALRIDPGIIFAIAMIGFLVFNVLRSMYQGYVKLKKTFGSVDLEQLKNRMETLKNPPSQEENESQQMQRKISVELQDLPDDPAQRIEKIRKIRDQYREAAGTSSPQKLQPSGPGNLSMKDVEARERAKAIYEARAAELRKLRSQPQGTTSIPNMPAQQPMANSPPPLPRQVAAAPLPSGPPQRRAAAQPQAPARPAPQRRATQAPSYEVAQENPVTIEPVSQAQSAVATSQSRAAAGKGKGAPIGSTSVTSLDTTAPTRKTFTLREAILWREILDKPLALRDEQ